MDETTTSRGQALRAAREARQMTQAHLAQAAGVSARTVMRAENGEDVSAESLRAICSVLHLDAETVGEAEAVRETARPVPEGVSTSARAGFPGLIRPSPYKVAMFACAGLAGIAFVSVSGWVVKGLVLPPVYANHLSWPETMGMRKALDLVGTLSRPMDALAGEVEPAAALAAADWSAAPELRPFWTDSDCDDPDFLAFLLRTTRECRPYAGGVRVGVSTPTRFEASVGPLPGKPLAMLARLLTPNPRLKVEVAFSDGEATPGREALWLDPRGLEDGQVPRYPGRRAYLHLVATLAEPAR